ncbi:hypothetical protein A0H81_09625 [Grifola frondosa]|uniref:Uncharacterized protein n=1 Tax=Grifola frondosa TaxID=5627 RepID=A0A1C7LZC6_GRIFR|nr:hypothetical protein A0H81_09625 [Grifola frondosa]
MHQHSATSPDFLSHPHTPPMTSFVDPSTGVPIFAPARQSSRIEIRAPTDATEGKKSTAPRPSTLRSSISGSATYPSAEQQQPRPVFFPNSSLPAAGEPGMFPPGEALPPTVEQPQVQVVDPGMGYPPYQQQYYYPESIYSSGLHITPDAHVDHSALRATFGTSNQQIPCAPSSATTRP